MNPNTNPDEAFRANLRRLRRGRSQAVVADEAGISQGRWSNWETGNRTKEPMISPSEIVRVADVLNVHPLELLGLPAPTGVEAQPPVTDLLREVAKLHEDDIDTLTNLARRLASERGRVELPQEVEEIAAQLTEPERRALARAIAQRDREDRLKVADESGRYDPDAGAQRPPRQGSARVRGGGVGDS